MSEWPTVRFEELAAHEKSAISKPYGSAFTANDYVECGVPMVRGVNLGTGRFVDGGFVFISDNKADQIPGANLRAGDLVFTHRGVIGQVAMVPRSPRFTRYVLSTSHVKARLNSAVALPEFYLYWFLSPTGQRAILAGISTVGVPGLAQPVATIKAIQVPHPPLAVQRSIAAVLGALDDKIAVNDHIGTCSLALADAHFGMAVAGVQPGPETFGSIAQVGGGGTPSTKVAEYWNGDIPWTTPSDVTALKAPYLFDTSRKISDQGLAECASVLYPAGSILMTSRATIGAFAIPQVPTAVNQGFIVVNSPTKELAMWLFHEMRDRVDEMRSLANGSTFLELSRKNFRAMEVRLPPSDVIRNFAETAIPLHQKVAAVSAENSTLAELREVLLPELMSGRVRVKDAEKIVEEAV
jgi:type I restriction enzyme S subunit